MRLKQRVKQWQDSELPAKRWAYPVAKAAWRTWQFLSVSELRSQRITGWRFPNKYYQRSPYTAPNRYPDLFEHCKTHLAKNPEPIILSFGCSTGEEVFSLAEYLPSAVIMGVDINAWCIRQCNQRKRSANHSFCWRFSREFEEMADFDAIFCMAVFQRSENRANPSSEVSIGFKFEQFEREIGILDTKLKPGGLLIIDLTDFSFEDTVHSRHYKALEFDGNSVKYSRPLFDRNNRRVCDTQCLNRVFVKE